MGHAILGTPEGVPYPCVTAPTAMGIRDLWLMDSRCIPQRGGVPTNILPGDARIIAYVSLSTQYINYEATVLVSPPSLGAERGS
jgi:hypothetical protein